MTDTTIGVDISKDHLDAHRWPEGESLRVSNDAKGHKALIRWIGDDVACVAYEATGAITPPSSRPCTARGFLARSSTPPASGASHKPSAPRPRPTASMPA